MPFRVFNEETWVTVVEDTWVARAGVARAGAGSEDCIADELVVREAADLAGAVGHDDLAARPLDADRLAADPAADEDPAAVDADDPLVADLPELGAGRVEALRVGQGGRARAGAGPPPGGRGQVAQGLVRADRVVVAAVPGAVGGEVRGRVAAGVEPDQLAGGGPVQALGLALGLRVVRAADRKST